MKTIKCPDSLERGVCVGDSHSVLGKVKRLRKSAKVESANLSRDSITNRTSRTI